MASESVEKAKAYAVCLKVKAFLAKETPGLKVRADKWRILIEEATSCKDSAAKKVGLAALQSAEKYAYVIRTLDEYIKKFSIWRADGLQVQKFLRNLDNGKREANNAYIDYKRDKMAAIPAFDKKDKYDSRTVGWLDINSPGWQMAKGVMGALAQGLASGIKVGW